LYALSATASSQRQYVLGDAPAHGTYAAKNQCLQEK
jgi:hypothetical protein